MKIYSLCLGDLATNCYIIETLKDNAVVIDPADSANTILKVLENNRLTLRKILLTHGHFDHILACEELREKTGAEVFIHEKDFGKLTDTVKNLFEWHGVGKYNPIKSATVINEGDVITQDEFSVTVMHTPGHTSGSVCYIGSGVIFSGDTLFAGSIGRTDFPTSSVKQMHESLKKLAALDKDYTVLSGHGPQTKLSEEKKSNIYMLENPYDDFL